MQWITHIKFNIKRNTNDNVLLDREFEPGTPASLVRCSSTELSWQIYIHRLSRPNYHVPPLTKVFPSKKHKTKTHVHPVRTYWWSQHKM